MKFRRVGGGGGASDSGNICSRKAKVEMISERWIQEMRVNSSWPEFIEAKSKLIVVENIGDDVNFGGLIYVLWCWWKKLKKVWICIVSLVVVFVWVGDNPVSESSVRMMNTPPLGDCCGSLIVVGR